MRVRLNIKPGRSGTKKLVAEYGERLICVRYRYDEKRKKRLKTVELIVEETDWEPPRRPFKDDEIVSVELDFKERELRSKVLQAGGTFNTAQKIWQIRYDRALKLGLRDRIRQIKSI
jgi:hypothetical protein